MSGPPGDRSRPLDKGGNGEMTQTGADLKSGSTVTQPADDLRDLELGYHIGYGNGYDIGYAHGVRDEGDAWTAVFTGCAETWRRPNYAEVEKTRATLRSCLCNRCSACVRRAAVERNIARYGQPNYPGGAR
jgi:hypothetical protein